MNIDIPISIGELIDKISILLIKEKNIKDERKLFLISGELTLLKEILNKKKTTIFNLTLLVSPIESVKKGWNNVVAINKNKKLKLNSYK